MESRGGFFLFGRPKSCRKWWKGGVRLPPRNLILGFFLVSKRASFFFGTQGSTSVAYVGKPGRWFFGRKGVFVGAYWFFRESNPARSVEAFFGTNRGLFGTFWDFFLVLAGEGVWYNAGGLGVHHLYFGFAQTKARRGCSCETER